MLTPAMHGSFSASPLARLSSSAPSRPFSSSLSPLPSTSGIIFTPGPSQLTSPSTSSPRTAPLSSVPSWALTRGRVFQVVLTFMAIGQRNTIQIIGLVCFNATFIIYSAMQVQNTPVPRLFLPSSGECEAYLPSYSSLKYPISSTKSIMTI